MPTEIADWNDLNAVRNGLSGDYVLVNDLDSSTTGYDNLAGPNANGGNGWDPIGDSTSDTAFTGTFDGQDNSISDIEISRGSTNGIGLFSLINSNANVSNLIIEDSSILGKGDFSDGGVGMLAGKMESGTVDSCRVNNCTIEGNGSYHGGLIGSGWDTVDSNVINCSVVDGSVTQQTGGGGRVGGLIGGTDGITTSNSFTDLAVNVGDGGRAGGLVGNHFQAELNKSYAIGSVDGNDYVGGLVGYNNDSNLTSSYSTGSVTGNDYVGGLVGDNEGDVTSSYSTGSVDTANNFAGGLVGYNEGDVTSSYSTGSVDTGNNYAGGLVGYNNGNVTSSYSTGSVTGTSNVGGLVGTNIDTVTSSYWDVDSSGQSSSAGGTGLPTSEMTGSQAKANMGGFDFQNTWKTVTTSSQLINDGYPVLRSQSAYIALSWSDNSNDETGFRIYNSNTANSIFPSDYAQVDEVQANTTIYEASNVDTSEITSYAVTAFNEVGESDPITVEVSLAPPVEVNGTEITAVEVDGQEISLSEVKNIEINGQEI